jgi:hypothetical protein
MIFKGRAKISTFLCGPPIGLKKVNKLYWSWKMGQQESSVLSMNQYETRRTSK